VSHVPTKEDQKARAKAREKEKAPTAVGSGGNAVI